jgi:hypothetical protein
MKFIRIIRAFVRVMGFITLTACVSSAATTGERIYHSFDLSKVEFDGASGNDRVEILDYLYGNPDGYAAKNSEEYRRLGKCAQSDSGYMNMPRKDLRVLYVKWRDNATGEVREVTLDLRKKFPKDFGENHRTFVSFRSGQLYVYVITPERRPEGVQPTGPRATDYLKTITIYPEQ